MKIVLTSFTPIGAGGGVPRWNRDITAAFPEGTVKHYSWTDVVKATGRDSGLPEWEKARTLNAWLRATKKIEKDDVILTDGFWGLGLDDFPNVVSVAHGNWSHTTADDVAKGVPPEFPQHHAVQVDYRRNHLKRGGRIVAVSEFIAHQCKLQWGFEFPVINNGIDVNKFKPSSDKKKRRRPVIIHGTTTANKGFDHIDMVKKLDADVLLLDEAPAFFGVPKYPALAQADLVVHPSAHEGNSYFVLETLASGVPIVSYDVGLMYQLRKEGKGNDIGRVLDRRERSKENTAAAVSDALLDIAADTDLDGNQLNHMGFEASVQAHRFSLEEFQKSWRKYLKEQFGV